MSVDDNQIPAFIRYVADVSAAVAFQAGVGGLETAGAIISHLAAHPERIDDFMAGGFFALSPDIAHHEHGELSWHGMDGKVHSPRDIRMRRIVADLARQHAQK